MSVLYKWKCLTAKFTTLRSDLFPQMRRRQPFAPFCNFRATTSKEELPTKEQAGHCCRLTSLSRTSEGVLRFTDSQLYKGKTGLGSLEHPNESTELLCALILHHQPCGLLQRHLLFSQRRCCETRLFFFFNPTFFFLLQQKLFYFWVKAVTNQINK